jgi:hypothetical protein
MKRPIYWLLGALAVPLFILSVVYHDSPILFLIGTVEVVLIAIVVNTFVFIYLGRNWRANPYGRALMYSKISLAFLANLSVITGVLGPDWEYRSSVRVLLFAGILIAQARLLHLLFSIRNEEAREEYDEAHDSAGREI